MIDEPTSGRAVANASELPKWPEGAVPLAIVMISLNEAHNMAAVLENLKGFASEIFLVDSFSSDETVDIALAHGVHVVQRRFRGFGDQWNFAVGELPITAPWTMKLDPDERLTDELKRSIADIVASADGQVAGFSLLRRLWFMGRPLPVRQLIVRGWKTGACRFTDVEVNEHPVVEGGIVTAAGYLEHHDSPSLQHWFDKQNLYTSQEALVRFHDLPLAAQPRLLGTNFERRMWFKRHFLLIPFRYQLYLLQSLFAAQVWRTGKAGLAWARLRVWVLRTIEDKFVEMKITGRPTPLPAAKTGQPHRLAGQAD